MQSTDEPLRDKNGLTEAEFLAAYSPKDYPRPSLTADICVFRKTPKTGLELLLIQRGGHPFLGCWATPGGFVNPKETADEAAERELAEETKVTGLKLEPVGLFSTPGRDPRGWTISYAFVALDDEGAIPEAGDDAAKAAWFQVAADEAEGRTTITLTHNEDVLTSSFVPVAYPLTGRLHPEDVAGEGLAFDHAAIVAQAWLALPEAVRS